MFLEFGEGSQSPAKSSLDSVSVRLRGGQTPDQLDGAESYLSKELRGVKPGSSTERSIFIMIGRYQKQERNSRNGFSSDNEAIWREGRLTIWGMMVPGVS